MKDVPFYKNPAFWLFIAVLLFAQAAAHIPGFIMDGDKPNPMFLAQGWQKAASGVFGAIAVLFIFLWSKDTVDFSKSNDIKNSTSYLVVIGAALVLSWAVLYF